MKIKGQKLETMKTAFTLVFNALGKEEVRRKFKLFGAQNAVWGIWNRASDDMLHDDNHPSFKHYPRIVPYNPTFDVYSEDTNDNHIETAILKILNDLLK